MNLIKKVFDNKSIIVALIIILLGIFLFRDLITKENLYFIEDTSHYFYPAAGFNLAAIQNGEIPLWIPYRYGGHPWLADIQTGFFYFIDYFVINFFGLYYPNIIIIVHYLLMCLFMYYYGRTINLDRFSSLLITIIFCVSGFIGETLKVGNLGILKTITYMPLIFLLLTKLLYYPKIKYVIILSLTAALQFFGGHFQFFFYSSFLAFIYFLFLFCYFSFYYKNKKYIIKLLSFSVLALIITLLLISIQLLPTYEFSNLSTRSGGVTYTFATINSISPDKLLEFVFQNIYGSSEKDYMGLSVPNHLGYIGFFPLVIIVSFFFFTKSKNKFLTYLAYFLISASFLSVLLSMGKHFPLFQLFFRYVFGFNFFRSVNRLLIIYTFCMSVLSGIAFNNLFYSKINQRIKYFIFILFISALFLFGLASLIIYKPENAVETVKNFYQYLWDTGLRGSGWHKATIDFLQVDRIYLLAYRILKYSLFCISSSALLYFIFMFKTKLKNIIFFCILSFLILDLSTTYINLIQKTLKDPDTVSDAQKNIVKLLNNNKGIHRISSAAVIPYNISLLQNLFEINGYGSLTLLKYNQFISMASNVNYRFVLAQGGIKVFVYDSHLLDILNVRYIIPYQNQMPLNQLDTRYKLIYKDELSGQTVYENLNTQPRIWMVNNYQVIPQPSQRVRKMTNKDFDYKNIVILEEEPDLEINKSIPLEYNAEIINYKLNEIHIKVNTNQNSILFLSENYYPDWYAYINGNKNNIQIANHTFRAVSVPKGNHDIIIKYEPKAFKKGLILSLTGISIIFIILIIKIIKYFLFCIWKGKSD